ncbi:hypothetical protein DFP72DRAFT_1055048 [Ephemerocybe angulata]|uniref:Uncharacterized protein n=1 Tax=Ephemerocybe angulata TaxID=980116 RepID=A0A8H6LSY9_9AGAR|nr:hypothetical protein DFP72DRAFT_1055048 [Tulosesus angulatus]
MNSPSLRAVDVVFAVDEHHSGWKKTTRIEIAESNGDITGIGAKLPVLPTASSSSPSASVCLHGRFSAHCIELASTCNQREGVEFRSEAVRARRLRRCSRLSPTTTRCILSEYNLCHASDPGDASAPAQMIELSSRSSLSLLYTFPALDSLPYTTTISSGNTLIHPVPPSLSPHPTPSSPPDHVRNAGNEIFQPGAGPSTTSSPSPPTARLGNLSPTLMHRFPPTPLNVQRRHALGPVDYAEGTVVLTSERLSVILRLIGIPLAA